MHGKKIREKNFNVVISDINEEKLTKAYKEVLSIKGEGKVSYCICDVTETSDISKLINFAISNIRLLIFGLITLELINQINLYGN